MNFTELVTDFCQALERKEYVVGIVSNLDNHTLYLDIYLDGEPICFHLLNGNLHYSYLKEITFMEIQYHNIHSYTKEFIKEANGFIVLEKLKTGTIQYDKTKKLTYYQKFLNSSFQNPLVKLYQKEKSHIGF